MTSTQTLPAYIVALPHIYQTRSGLPLSVALQKVLRGIEPGIMAYHIDGSQIFTVYPIRSTTLDLLGLEPTP